MTNLLVDFPMLLMEILDLNRITLREIAKQLNVPLYIRKQEEAIKEKRPKLANRKGIVFHRDNPRPYTSSTMHTKLLELGRNNENLKPDKVGFFSDKDPKFCEKRGRR